MENFDKLHLPLTSMFLAETSRMFLTYPCLKKGVRDFFIIIILYRSWAICKNKKRPGFYALVMYIFINNSRSKQNKKILLSRKRVQNFSKKYETLW